MTRLLDGNPCGSRGVAAYLYLGGPTGLETTPSATLPVPSTAWGAAAWGVAMANAGDVNGDGYGDVVLGAPNQ
jgi:hypothetical protein